MASLSIWFVFSFSFSDSLVRTLGIGFGDYLGNLIYRFYTLSAKTSFLNKIMFMGFRDWSVDMSLWEPPTSNHSQYGESKR